MKFLSQSRGNNFCKWMNSLSAPQMLGRKYFFHRPLRVFFKIRQQFLRQTRNYSVTLTTVTKTFKRQRAKIMITWLFLPFARRKHVKLKDLRVYTHKLADTKKISIFVIEHFFCNKYADFLKTKKNSVKKKSTIFFKICLFIT